MAYNLPPPWDAGFALPENVRDEGLERRGFVTKQAPRGTYDAPHVGTGGYTVPPYVVQERYGQGAYGTKMMPRGTKPNVPNYIDRRPQVVSQRSLPGGGNAVTIALSGSDLHDYGSQRLGMFQQYGQRVAVILMQQADRLPTQALRVEALKRIMDEIDPTLHSRAKGYADKAAKQGAAPRLALAHGISAAVSEGVLGELAKLGQTRRTPKPNSLLGLGCYGPMGFGDTAMLQTNLLSTQVANPNLMTMQFSVMPPAPQGALVCLRPGYTWVAASGSTPGHYERVKADGIQMPGPADPATGACAVSETRVHASAVPDFPTLTFGPWKLRDVEGQRTSFAWSSVTPEQAKALIEWITKGYASFMVSRVGVGGSLPPPVAMITLADAGLAPSSSKVPKDIISGRYPIAKFTHPKTGKKEALYVTAIGTKETPAFALTWKYDPNLGEAAWKAFYELHAIPTRATIDFLEPIVKGALDSIGDATCNLVQKPGAVQAGQAAAVAGPYGMAIAAGTTVADQLCKSDVAPLVPGPLVEPDSGFPVLPVAIAGGLAIAAYLYTKKKKP